ncbi:MAG: hypothetical protein HY255_06420 [Betaproteobacteria bacterium]|nr:hypothetical protein [Betaproteobacteria bacterium]
MYESFYISSESADCTLEDIAQHVFDALDIEKTEKRESSHVSHGYYFAGYATNASIKIRHQDEWGIDFPYLAHLETVPTWATPKRKFELNLDPSDIARRLATAGVRAFLPIGDDSRIDWDGKGTLYTQGNPAGTPTVLKV